MFLYVPPPTYRGMLNLPSKRHENTGLNLLILVSLVITVASNVHPKDKIPLTSPKKVLNKNRSSCKKCSPLSTHLSKSEHLKNAHPFKKCSHVSANLSKSALCKLLTCSESTPLKLLRF